MQILSRLILRRRPNVVPSTAHCFSSPSRSRPLLSFMASSSPRWSPPAVARRASALMVDPNQPVRRISRGGRKDFESAKPVISSANDTTTPLPERSTKAFIAYGDGHVTPGEEDGMGLKTEENERTDINFIYGDHDARRTAVEVVDDKTNGGEEIVDMRPAGDDDMDDTESTEYSYYPMPKRISELEQLPYSTHRDGSIYKDTGCPWKRDYRIADRSETGLEPMMQSHPTEHCLMENGLCWYHITHHMVQFLSLKLAKIVGDGGPVELYGYIALRDQLEPLMNYIVNISRNDPIIVEQGSFINMTGPKRGIDLIGTLVVEFDMRIKTGEQEKDDLQLIDGVTLISEQEMEDPIIYERIHGDNGVVDITSARLGCGVEATVEVAIAEVQSSLNMCLSCFTSGLPEEIRLFDGAIGEPGVLNRFVVAVSLWTSRLGWI